jgi:raffinose/stachyose/melibiose transport system permease protein
MEDGENMGNLSEVPSVGAASAGPRAGAGIRGSVKADRFVVGLASHLVLIVFALIVVYPVVWMVLASVKSTTELSTNIWGLPHGPLALTNYIKAWQNANLGNALINNMVVSGSVVIIVGCLAALAGFAFARFAFRLAIVLFLIFIFTMQAPTPIIPLYVLMARLHLGDNLFGLILVLTAGGLPLSIFVFQAYFQSLPGELLDAAKVDGCSDLGAFLRVVVPISGPAFATVAILQFVSAWNEFFLPLVLIHTPTKETIPLALLTFFYTQGRTYWTQVFAALSIGTLPIIILYLFMQRWFVQGLTAGAIKG